jgi:RNA recognition motif-containing protein
MSVTGDFKLFVGNMPGDVSPEEIRIAFSKFGPIVEVYIMGGNRSRSGQSSAFVKFTTPDACNLAIQEMHMKGKIRHSDSDFLAVKFAKATPVSSPRSVIQPSPFSSSSDLSSGTQSVGTTMFLAPMGSIIGISPSEYLGSMTDSGGSTTAASSPYITPLPSPRPPLRTCKLFVGGLPIFVDRDDLIAIFCPFGKVESVHLMNNNKSKSGQNCAFINYYSRDCAKKAIDSLSARYQTDDSIAPLTVRFADSNPTETADADGNSRKKQRLNNSGAVLFPDLAKQLAQQAALSILSNENVSEP